mmetsp:Transcript_44419/g.96664  ORF Transcript_44419/g.96664 Transcript_44419/m.96664 type:complete len:294 (+) Transcript_44419:63-944(+)
MQMCLDLGNQSSHYADCLLWSAPIKRTHQAHVGRTSAPTISLCRPVFHILLNEATRQVLLSLYRTTVWRSCAEGRKADLLDRHRCVQRLQHLTGVIDDAVRHTPGLALLQVKLLAAHPAFHSAPTYHGDEDPLRDTLHTVQPDTLLDLHPRALQQEHFRRRRLCSRGYAAQINAASIGDGGCGIREHLYVNWPLRYAAAALVDIKDPAALTLRPQEHRVPHLDPLRHRDDGALARSLPSLGVGREGAPGAHGDAIRRDNPVKPRAVVDGDLHHALSLVDETRLRIEAPTLWAL